MPRGGRGQALLMDIAGASGSLLRSRKREEEQKRHQKERISYRKNSCPSDTGLPAVSKLPIFKSAF